MKSKQLEKALFDLDRAIKINPQYARAYANRGLLYYQLENISQSKQDLEKARDLFFKQGDVQKSRKVEQLLQQLLNRPGDRFSQSFNSFYLKNKIFSNTR